MRVLLRPNDRKRGYEIGEARLTFDSQWDKEYYVVSEGPALGLNYDGPTLTAMKREIVRRLGVDARGDGYSVYEADAALVATLVAESEKEEIRRKKPDDVVAALKQYRSSNRAWEAGDETAWALLDRYGY